MTHHSSFNGALRDSIRGMLSPVHKLSLVVEFPLNYTKFAISSIKAYTEKSKINSAK